MSGTRQNESGQRGVLTAEERKDLERAVRPAGAKEAAEPSLEELLALAPIFPLVLVGLGSGGVALVRSIIDSFRAWGYDCAALLYDTIALAVHEPLLLPDARYRFREPGVVLGTSMESLSKWPEQAYRRSFSGVTHLDHSPDGARGHAQVGLVLFEGALAQMRIALQDAIARHAVVGTRRSSKFAQQPQVRPRISVVVAYSSTGGSGRAAATGTMALAHEIGRALKVDLDIIPVVIGLGAYGDIHPFAASNDAAARAELLRFATTGEYALGPRGERLRRAALERGRIIWLGDELPRDSEGKVVADERDAYISRSAYTVATALASGALTQALAAQDTAGDRNLVTTMRLSGAVVDRNAIQHQLAHRLGSQVRQSLAAELLGGSRP